MEYYVLADEDFDLLFCKSGPDEIGGAVYSPVSVSIADAVRVSEMLGVQFPFVPKRVGVEELEQHIRIAASAGCKYIGFVKGFVDNAISLSLQRISSDLTSPKET